MPLLDINFTHNVHNDGKNMTVVRGSIYESKDYALINNKVIRIETKAMRFCDINTSDIAHHQDPGLVIPSELLKHMKEVYENFDEREIVTLVYYEL